MALTTLELGPVGAPIAVFVDEDASLFSAEYTAGVDVIGVRLTVDTATCIVNWPANGSEAEVMAGLDFSCEVSSDGYVICSNRGPVPDLRKLPGGTEARIYRLGQLFMKLYKKDVDRITKTKFSLSLVSAIGLFEDQKHLGGFYHGTTFGAILQEIIGDAVPYTVSDEVAAIQVQGGYLPYQSKRDNLHWLAFAYGVMIGRNSSGDMDFRFLTNREVITVPEGTFYQGGNVKSPDVVTGVDVTEHSFMALPTDETVVVFDNSAGMGSTETADHTFLSFGSNAPLHDLAVTGTLVIESSGANWAIVSGTGALSGKKYTHSTRILTKYADNTNQDRERVADLSKNTMVTVLNSENVAARMLAYYTAKKIVETSMVVTDQQLGDLLSGIDPFGESLTGFFSSVRGIISTKIKGTSQLIADYVPTGQGNNYTRYQQYTGSGTINWTTLLAGKADADPVMLQLVGGGEGGHSGDAGGAGTDPQPSGLSGSTDGIPGEGGEGGAPGAGGKVLTFTMTAGALRALGSSAYSCGVGGASDSPGGATTILGRSSDEGAAAPYGVSNIFTGEIYGLAGTESGQKGGKGSSRTTTGETVSNSGQSWTPGANGTAGTYSYNWGTGTVRHYITRSSSGGYGGGAAVGSNGGAASASTNGDPGKGGAGATPAARAAATGFGQGGAGGHGGGGAGAGGTGTERDEQYISGEYDRTYVTGLQGTNGDPGPGGPGGQGGPGVLNIYL